MNKLRIFFGTLVALLLVSVLVFLILKTQTVDVDKHNEIIATLRELKQVDAEWNVDVLKSKTGVNNSYDPVASPLPLVEALEKAVRSKTDEVWGRNDNLQALIASYRSAMDEKISTIEQFKSQNAILRNSSRFLPVAANDMIVAVRASGLPAANKIATEQSLNGLLTNTMSYTLTPETQIRDAIEQSSSTLQASAAQLPADLRERFEVFGAHVATILRQQVRGDALLTELGALPTAKRIDELSNAFQGQHDAAVRDGQSYRYLLVGYSAFLLLALVYFGWRLAQSYRTVHNKNVDLKLANDQLKESQMALVQSEKMSALGQMVAGIAHEINTPLAYVKGTLSVLADQLDPIKELATRTFNFTQMVRAQNNDKQVLNQHFAKVTDVASTIQRDDVVSELGTLIKDGLHGIDQISEIVVNLKNFSRLDRAKVSEFSVEDGLESTLLLARNMLKNTVKITKKYSQVAKITCSPSQINQVFLNIITNAVHALPEELSGTGEITLTTHQESANQVRIDIEDNGTGIPKDVLPKIFDPFFTTKEIGKGTGMGLSISYKIIQEHGGSISVESVAGQGTRFSILLPVRSAQSTAPVAPGANAQPAGVFHALQAAQLHN
jgi:two-component system, NtrC family, sensor kinase